MRPPVSLERLVYDAAGGKVEIRSRAGSDDDCDGGALERMDAACPEPVEGSSSRAWSCRCPTRGGT